MRGCVARLGLLLFGSLLAVRGQIRVMAPDFLIKSLGKHGKIVGSTSTFGAPFFGDRVLGRLVWGESLKGDHHCSEDDYQLPVAPKEQLEEESSLRKRANGGLIDIVVVRRGKCSFVTKVRVALAKGAHAVIVVDQDDSTLTEADMHRIIVKDDGYGGGLHIPSILISKQQGAQLIEAVKRSHVIVELKWDIPTDKVVQMDLWMNSASKKSMKFLKEFSPRRKALNEVVKFQPHYAVFGMPATDPAVYRDLCSDTSGSYCAEDPDGNGAVTGKDALEEDVRQLCIHELTKVPRNSLESLEAGRPIVEYAEKYWSYVERLIDECPIDAKSDEGRFGTVCAERLMKAVGLDVEKVQDCMRDTKDRKLKAEKDNTAWSPQALRINGWRYTGMLDADLVTRAVCSGFIDQPKECADLLAPRNPFEKYVGLPIPTSQGISITTLILGLLFCGMLAFAGMMLYKKSLNKHMSSAIREEVMLEVQAHMASYSKLSADL